MSPAILGGGLSPSALARAYRIEPVLQSGRMSISSTLPVVRPHSLWWSTIECTVAFSTPSGSSAGLFVSTIATEIARTEE